MPVVRVYVESLADEKLAHLLLASEPARIVESGTPSGANSGAATALNLRPQEPVALLLGTRTNVPEEISAKRASNRRLLEWGNFSDKYYIALAEQRLLDWVLTDPKLRQAFDESPPDMKIYADRAARAAELAKQIGFDNTVLLQQSADYRGLLDFIHQHAGASKVAS